MTINVGDTVEAIDDAITGKVISVDGSTLTIDSQDGFQVQLDVSEVVVVNAHDDIHSNVLLYDDISDIKQQKSETKRKSVSSAKVKDRHKPTFIVDLHIHQLTDSTKGMTNFDMLNLQLDTARQQLEFAIRKRMLKMVFIHGVGEGVLRQELYTLLRRYNNVSFYDADYKLYGLGATEVRIFQNVLP